MNNILYSCGNRAQRSGEQFIDVHALVFVLTGELHLITPDKAIIMKVGSMGLIKRNQLVKATKVPPFGGEFSSINIFLSQDILRKHLIENPQEVTVKSNEESVFEIQRDTLLKAYFQSLQPYFQAPERFTPQLAELKTKEAVELILNIKPELKEVLFDFSEPHKIDLEAFMHQNYMFNVSIDGLAKLTGRSRAGFKRDFEKIFRTSPGQWIKQRRLEQAYYLIKEKRIKPSAAYLDVGFENLSHFSYAFKKAFGVNPSSLLHA